MASPLIAIIFVRDDSMIYHLILLNFKEEEVEMKKILILILAIVFLVGCGKETGDISESGETNEANQQQDVEAGQEKDEVEKEEIPIHPDWIEADITILEPDSIGNVYME